jgi:hypothetical protein
MTTQPSAIQQARLYLESQQGGGGSVRGVGLQPAQHLRAQLGGEVHQVRLQAAAVHAEEAQPGLGGHAVANGGLVAPARQGGAGRGPRDGWGAGFEVAWVVVVVGVVASRAKLKVCHERLHSPTSNVARAFLRDFVLCDSAHLYLSRMSIQSCMVAARLLAARRARKLSASAASSAVCSANPASSASQRARLRSAANCARAAEDQTEGGTRVNDTDTNDNDTNRHQRQRH